MNMTGIVYRPPYEANSLLLQVTLGCSHNKCTFCYMYPNVQFTVCPMEEVEADIEEATHYCPNVKRVFLEHGDAFVLSADRLLKIADAIHRKLPRVETIAMYASIQNIKSKTDEELRQLRAAGIHGLDIGVESGLDDALTYMNKGHTAKEAREQLLRLTEDEQEWIEKAGLSERHARALLRIENEATRREALSRIVADNLNVKQTEHLVGILLHSNPKPEKAKGNSKAVIKDVRIFLNTINKAIDTMRLSGIDAQSNKTDTNDFIEYTIRIPKAKTYPPDKFVS